MAKDGLSRSGLSAKPSNLLPLRLYESFLARCVIIQPHRTIQPGFHSCRSTQICQSHDVPCSIGGIFVEGTVHLNGLLNRSLDLDSAGPAFVDSCDTVQSAQAQPLEIAGNIGIDTSTSKKDAPDSNTRLQCPNCCPEIQMALHSTAR